FDPCEVWCHQPVDKLREYCNVIKIRIFWPVLFQSESNYWGSSQVLDCNWKNLCDLELVEDLVDLTKKIVGFFDAGNALDWIRSTGDISVLQKLEKSGDYRWICLETFFAECKRYIIKVAVEDCNLVEEFNAVTCENCRKWFLNCSLISQKSEFMKQKGNEEFSQGKFDHAIVSYTKAIEFWRALVDGKRATILKPDWPKGHYHFCKALSLMGEHELALEANERAQELCKNILDGLKDLIQQNDKLKKTLEEIKGQSHQHKGRSKNKPGEPEKKQDHLDLKIESKTIQDKLLCTVQQVDSTMLLEKVKSLVRDGYTALMDQRCRSAEQVFSQLLSILDPSELKQLNLCVINYVVIIYGHATSLLGIGQPEALSKAEDQFKRIIEQYQEERFDCLAYYGIGKVYLRQNRFSDALDQFMKSQTMINHKIIPGVITWPTTSQVIEETRTKNLQLLLKNCIEECKFPPEPDAVCRYQQCHGYSKIQIYFTDPDFKGFIRITCCQQCRVEFHTSCWKKLKTAKYSDKNDKDFLRELCFTPDCTGLISRIVIFNSSGLVKCEFEQKITKTKEPPRASIKQKCSRLNTVCLFFNPIVGYAGYAGDQVLQRIIQNAEQIKTAVRDASKLVKELLSWFVISDEDYASYCKASSTSHAVVEQLIGYLVQEENRVKTRGFVYVLSELEEVDPKIQKWMKHLNDLGLTATENFILQYGQFLKQLDVSILTALWNEKYGSKFECVSSSSEGKEILDYFLKPPLEKVRCFIWLLEDNRENFPALHQALDEFFDITDDLTVILKKHGNEDLLTNGIKVKNKSRKKNCKDSRSVLVLSSGVSTAPQEENTFIEENTLDFAYYEPCIIPEYLRRQLEEFEAVYDLSNCNSYQGLDDNSNLTCESLYDYFSQILEEHGPMELNNKLLVGEYEHFPEEARKVVEDEGGLKPFLLKSRRFIMVDNYISLRHEESTNGDENEDKEEGNYIACDVRENSFQNKIKLNPAAEEFRPRSYPKHPHISMSTDIPLESCDTQQCLPYCLPTSWQSLLSHDIDPVKNTPHFSQDLFYQDFQNQSRFLPQTSWGYQCERTSPVTSPVPLLSNTAKQPGYIYADRVAHQGNDELAVSDRKYVSSSFIPTETETCRVPQCLMENLGNTSYEDSFTVANNANEAEGDIQAIKKKKESRSKTVLKNNPHTRMIAVQVNNEVTDRETNTLPFHPFEKQQLFKKELEWLHQALEMKVKKWQQEKKENQEKLKAMRNTAKKHMDTNDRYSKTIDEKEKQYNTCLNTYLETSNKFANEKVKLEELIKKSQDDCKEHEKRAVKAEISVLKNWKEMEIYKLNCVVAKAEASLKSLSSSASALPESKSQINYWEVFISNKKKQMEKVEVGYGEKIEKVKNGVRNCLTKIEAVDLSSLLSVLVRILRSIAACSEVLEQSRAAVGDAALVMYSSASAHLNLPPVASSSEDQGPTTASFNTQAGVKPTYANSKTCSASDGSVKMNSRAQRGLYADKVSLISMPKASGSSTQNTQPNLTHQDDSATQMRPSSNNTFENIIAHLQTIFPGYSRYFFSVCVVLCLASASVGRPVKSASSASVGRGTQSQEAAAEGKVSSTPKAWPAHKSTSSHNTSQPHFQPWENAAATPKSKWKNSICIRKWLKEHSSTCPICRIHVLLPEDFPELPARNKYA
ncbi:UNVERIFIED_CONTAM: hypothetical protein H355_000330, partial [Colinus virginianus]